MKKSICENRIIPKMKEMKRDAAIYSISFFGSAQI